MSKPFLKAADLKGTRLELRYEDCTPDHEMYKEGYPLFCRYSLVLTLDKYDIRAEDGEGNLGVNREKRLSLGGSWTSAKSPYNIHTGDLSTPFRDGAHIVWDHLRLSNLPMHVVYGNDAQVIEVPEEIQDKSVRKLAAIVANKHPELGDPRTAYERSLEDMAEDIVRTVLAEWPNVAEENS